MDRVSAVMLTQLDLWNLVLACPLLWSEHRLRLGMSSCWEMLLALCMSGVQVPYHGQGLSCFPDSGGSSQGEPVGAGPWQRSAYGLRL